MIRTKSLQPTLIVVLILLTCIESAFNAARAENLLDNAFAAAPGHDFVDHFDFKEAEVHQIRETGLTEHIFFSQSCGSVLELGETAGRIVHMRVRVPRELFEANDVAANVLARDLVKSFIESCATTSSDWAKLKTLSDEVYIRGLELHPIAIGADQKFKDTGKAVPENGYFVGHGPYQRGKPVIFPGKIPKLSPSASELFLAVMGKKESAFEILSNCRLAVISYRAAEGKRASVCCDAWDEAYWQQHLEPPKTN